MDRNLRELVWQRANDCCEYCQMPQRLFDATHEIDHVIAEKHLGPTTLENLALACFPCNNHKGPNIAGLDQPTGELTRLFNPRTDRWHEHFRWNAAELIGLTAIGRAIIHVLEINLPHRMAHRQSLIEEGVFPSLPKL